MPKQPSIKSFFGRSPAPPAGVLRSSNKRDLDEKGDSATSMSPEAKRRSSESRTAAKILREVRRFPAVLDSLVGASWFRSLEGELSKPYFAELNRFVESERGARTIFPPETEVWSWSRHFDVRDTRAVVIGQDPYHGAGQAHGLCFSVKPGVASPPSLLNIFKELESDEDVSFSRPPNGCLEGWARQGVLLLNACLTVRSGQANSHKERGWEKLTDRVIKAVSDECPEGVVFLLWGAYAQKKAAAVDRKKHHLLKSVHPSPLSAHRGFLGCRHFSKCNELLKQSGRQPIDWNALDK